MRHRRLLHISLLIGLAITLHFGYVNCSGVRVVAPPKTLQPTPNQNVIVQVPTPTPSPEFSPDPSPIPVPSASPSPVPTGSPDITNVTVPSGGTTDLTNTTFKTDPFKNALGQTPTNPYAQTISYLLPEVYHRNGGTYVLFPVNSRYNSGGNCMPGFLPAQFSNGSFTPAPAITSSTPGYGVSTDCGPGVSPIIRALGDGEFILLQEPNSSFLPDVLAQLGITLPSGVSAPLVFRRVITATDTLSQWIHVLNNLLEISSADLRNALIYKNPVGLYLGTSNGVSIANFPSFDINNGSAQGWTRTFAPIFSPLITVNSAKETGLLCFADKFAVQVGILSGQLAVSTKQLPASQANFQPLGLAMSDLTNSPLICSSVVQNGRYYVFLGNNDTTQKTAVMMSFRASDGLDAKIEFQTQERIYRASFNDDMAQPTLIAQAASNYRFWTPYYGASGFQSGGAHGIPPSAYLSWNGTSYGMRVFKESGISYVFIEGNSGGTLGITIQRLQTP